MQILSRLLHLLLQPLSFRPVLAVDVHVGTGNYRGRLLADRAANYGIRLFLKLTSVQDTEETLARLVVIVCQHAHNDLKVGQFRKHFGLVVLCQVLGCDFKLDTPHASFC